MKGPHPRYSGVDTPDWRFASRDDLLTKFRILNAYYLPAGGGRRVYARMSSVNTFRVIFDNYFGGRIALLPDVSFISTKETPYRFIDVTERIRRPRGDNVGADSKAVG